MSSALPNGSAERKAIPLARGALDYFPAALAAVADLSRAGNEKHNPGEDLHWSRGKSNDHADCLLRHLVDRGTTDPEDGIPHSVKVAWRALALLQEELEAQGAPLARGAVTAEPEQDPRELLHTEYLWANERHDELWAKWELRANGTVEHWHWSRGHEISHDIDDVDDDLAHIPEQVREIYRKWAA